MMVRNKVLFHERFVNVVRALYTNDAYSAAKAAVIAQFAESHIEPEHRPPVVAALEAKIAEFDTVQKSNGVANSVNNRFKDTIEQLRRAQTNLSAGQVEGHSVPSMETNRPPLNTGRRNNHQRY